MNLSLLSICQCSDHARRGDEGLAPFRNSGSGVCGVCVSVK